MARRPATRSMVRKPKSPEGMVNGLKTTVINSDTVAELTKLCDESNFKTPKELDINVSIKPCFVGSQTYSFSLIFFLFPVESKDVYHEWMW